ncbi:sodium:solute symporter family protein [Paradesulfitobacterium ferrireducens]|uniref:sodium:solute symporter family protein n=1 Tax=Paradesulfitobacterium ferrireducens TaxID=2816476 RepID=UPI001A8CB727|nr:hypothetical protein [Paradesulfitobacterium ferrireducens]
MSENAGTVVFQMIFAIVLFIVLTIVINAVVSRMKVVKDIESYLVSGRMLPWPLTTAILVSAWIFTSSTMGAAESSLSFGASGLWMYSMYGLSLLAVGLIIPRFKKISDRLNIDSLTDFIKNRYNDKNYWLFLLIIWIGSYLTLLFNVSGAGFVISGLSGGVVPYWVGPAALGIITMIYLVRGGLWSTALASWIFALIASIGVVANIPFIVDGAGGTSAILQYASASAQKLAKPEVLSLWNPEGAKVFLLATILYGFSGWAVQEWYQPGIASQPKKIRRAYMFAFFWVILITSLSGAMGFIGFALVNSGQISAPATSSEIYPYLTALYSPKIIQLLMMFMVFAAGSGTVAVTALAQSTMLKGAYDLLRERNQTKAIDNQIVLSRLKYYIVVAILVAIIFSAVIKPSVLFMVLLACAVYAPLGIPMMLTIFWKGVNRQGLFWAVLIGEIVTIYLFFAESPGIATLAGTIIGTVITVLWSVIAPAKSEQTQIFLDQQIQG